jgi:hypothetical protein
MKRILKNESPDWYIKRINQPTSAQNFKGEKRYFDHYYRIYRADGTPIAYCKFQQLDRFAHTLNIPTSALPMVEGSESASSESVAKTA